ncbi:MAG: hypothetical protein JNK78_11120 [Planctomycetes bacterium]|nr:hypothetical protein [Planctomycetota bacterium]
MRCLPVGRTSLVLSLSMLTGTVGAQVGSRGVLAGAPAAVLVDGGISPGADAETRVHRNGFSLAPTIAFPATPSAPDLAAILAANGAPAGLDVDDISTGRDDVLFDGNGVMTVEPSSWAAMSFSLRVGATGVVGSGSQGPSRIAQQAAAGDIGTTLFSWIFPGSSLPAQLVGVVERSHSRAELGLPVGTNEVDGLDVPLVLGLDQAALGQVEPNFGALIANPQAIYFTVSHATRDLVPVSWQLYGPSTTLSSGATIYRVLRSTPLGSWTPPHVFRPYWAMGLSRDEDIDALAVDIVRQKMLYSMVGTTRDQFLVHDLSTDGIPVPRDALLPDGTTKVSQSIGKAQNDDVDAVCTLDPTIGSIGSPPPAGDDFGWSCGTPRQGLLGTPAIHASAFRRREAGATWYDSWMIGWPPSTGVGPGFAAMFLTFGPALDLNLFSPIFLRNPASPLVGDPQTFALAVPPTISLTGFDVTVRWFAADGSLSEIAEAWPVQLFL